MYIVYTRLSIEPFLLWPVSAPLQTGEQEHCVSRHVPIQRILLEHKIIIIPL
jgi:hypothetical protein